MQEKILNIAHEGHQGVVRTKQLLRSCVWFPGINKKVESLINSCLACQAVDETSAPNTPIQMTPMPEAPWTNVSIDFFGPVHPGNEYLMVLIDDFSRFPIVDTVYSIKCSTIVRRLDNLFGIFGIPEVLRSDNGPPFNSCEFQRFADYIGFKHRRITPEYPQANGIAESFMKNLGKVLKTARIDNVHWSTRLNEFLRNYRSTPHTTTGFSPAQLFFKNAKQTRLPRYENCYKPDKNDSKAIEIDNANKIKTKIRFDNKHHTQTNYFKEGDLVLVKQRKNCKSKAPFNTNLYRITNIKGNMITAKSTDTNNKHVTTRNITFFKKWRGNANYSKANQIQAKKAEEHENRKPNCIINYKLEDDTVENELLKFNRSFESLVMIWNNKKNSLLHLEAVKVDSIHSFKSKSSLTDEESIYQEAQGCAEIRKFSEEKLEQILNAGALSSDINIEKLELELDQLLTESTDRVLRTRIKEVNYRDAREYCKKSE